MEDGIVRQAKISPQEINENSRLRHRVFRAMVLRSYWTICSVLSFPGWQSAVLELCPTMIHETRLKDEPERTRVWVAVFRSMN